MRFRRPDLGSTLVSVVTVKSVHYVHILLSDEKTSHCNCRDFSLEENAPTKKTLTKSHDYGSFSLKKALTEKEV